MTQTLLQSVQHLAKTLGYTLGDTGWEYIVFDENQVNLLEVGSIIDVYNFLLKQLADKGD